MKEVPGNTCLQCMISCTTFPGVVLVLPEATQLVMTPALAPVLLQSHV